MTADEGVAVASWCNCAPTRPYSPAGRRIFTVTDPKNERFMLEVEAYCLDCKGVLKPPGRKLRVTDSDGEDALLRARAAALGAAARGQIKGSSLGVGWISLIGSLQLPRLRIQQLYSDWSAHRPPTAKVREAMHALVGLSPVVTKATIDTPIGPVEIDHAGAEHPVASYPDRYDPDHCSYLGLTKPTLQKPIEVWQSAATADRPERLCFLAAYIVGLTLTTHMVIVDVAQNRVTTSYKLNDHETRADNQREGSLRYKSW